MTFADYVMAVPTGARLGLAVLVTVSISLLFVWLFHAPAVRLSVDPEHPEDDSSPQPPASYHLGGRLLALISTAFVFLLAFSLGQIWANNKAADAENNALSLAYSRMVGLASNTPDDVGGAELRQALTAYRAGFVEREWPLLQVTDADGAREVSSQLIGSLGQAVSSAGQAGAAELPAWDTMTTALDDLTVASANLIATAPAATVAGVLLLVGVLGILNMAAAAAFQPARLPMHLLYIGCIAAVTAMLFFLLVELSNPFIGGAAIHPMLVGG